MSMRSTANPAATTRSVSARSVCGHQQAPVAHPQRAGEVGLVFGRGDDLESGEQGLRHAAGCEQQGVIIEAGDRRLEMQEATHFDRRRRVAVFGGKSGELSDSIGIGADRTADKTLRADDQYVAAIERSWRFDSAQRPVGRQGSGDGLGLSTNTIWRRGE